MHVFLEPWFLLLLKAILVPLLVPIRVRIKAAGLREDKSAAVQLELVLPGRIKILSRSGSIGLTRPGSEKGSALLKELWRALRQKDFFLKSQPKNLELLRRLLFSGLRFAGRLRWKRFNVWLGIGTGDAAATAVLAGLMRTLFSFVSRFFYSRFGFRPHFVAAPSFERPQANFILELELKLNILKVLLFLLQVCFIILGWRLKKK